jgi:hypothetical protein
MRIGKVLVGKVQLNCKIDSMPDGGIAEPRIRVELAEEEKLDSAWIGELTVLGDLPWNQGEERQVEIRIMSDEFMQNIALRDRNILVKRGSKLLGNLKLEG